MSGKLNWQYKTILHRQLIIMINRGYLNKARTLILWLEQIQITSLMNSMNHFLRNYLEYIHAMKGTYFTFDKIEKLYYNFQKISPK